MHVHTHRPDSGLTAYTDGLHTVLPHDLLLCSMQSFTGACSQCGQLGGFQVLDWAINGLYFASYTTCRLVGIHSCCKDVHAALSSAARASSAEAQQVVWHLVPRSAALPTGICKGVYVAMEGLHSAESSICASADTKARCQHDFSDCTGAETSTMTVPCPAPCSSLLHCLWQLLKSLTLVMGPGAHLLRAALLQGRDVGHACESQNLLSCCPTLRTRSGPDALLLHLDCGSSSLSQQQQVR